MVEMTYNKIKNKLPTKIKKLGIKILKKQYDGHEERFYAKFKQNEIIDEIWVGHYLIYKKMLEHANKVPTLDLCCGSGAGTAILSESIKEKIIGVDYSDDAINFAKKHNQNSFIEYKKLDLNKNNNLAELKKIIILNKLKQVFFIEGIEHIKNPEKVISILKEAGIELILITTPFEEETVGIKGYHISPFTPTYYNNFSKKFNSEILGYAKFVEAKKAHKQIKENIAESDLLKEYFTKDPSEAINYLIKIEN